jgi:glycosyltransferase involved in cell wall biosynthesis
VAIEAGSASRPVVGTPGGGLAEIIDHEVTGLHVPPARPDLLHNAIKTFVDQPELVITMGRAAKQRTKTIFSYKQFIDRFTTVIDSVEAA